MNELVEATDEHAVRIAPRLLLKDALEFREAMRLSPVRIVRESLAMSLHAWTWLKDGEPACIFGLAGNLIGVKVMPWLFATEEVGKNPMTFWRECKRIFPVLREHYPAMEGYCDARFTQSARWLERLGFRLSGPHEIAGIPLLTCTMER